MEKFEMSVSKSFPSGAFVVTAIIDGQLVTRRYFGYTQREAKQAFREEIKQS
jgi:hypothetical protein